MLAYAANRPVPVDRRPHPNTMLFIIGAHVALVAAVMSAKMEIQRHRPDPPIVVETIKRPPDPPPIAEPNHPSRPTTNWVSHTQQIVKTKPIDSPPVDLGPSVDPNPFAGAGTNAIANYNPRPIAPVRSEPVLLTPPTELKPPYPASKLLNEEEAVLTLRLTIDSSGRVIAVDPVGRADAAFLEAARRHLIAHWRYRPASEDGQAIATTAVVTLHFEIEG